MGGFRDSIKAGGGLFNNVDAIIKSYLFTSVGPGEDGEETDWVYFVPTFRVDGADEDQSQHLFFGALERLTISKDGQSVEAIDGDVRLNEKLPAGRFLATLLDNAKDGDGFDPDDVEGGETLDLTPITGLRVRLQQEVDVEGTKKRGKRKGKDGKSYDRTITIVSAVYGRADAKAGKTGKIGTASKSKKNGAVDLNEDGAAVLLEILGDIKGNSIARGKLSLPLTKVLMSNDNGPDLKRLIQSEAFLETEEGWSYDSKKEVVSLA